MAWTALAMLAFASEFALVPSRVTGNRYRRSEFYFTAFNFGGVDARLYCHEPPTVRNHSNPE